MTPEEILTAPDGQRFDMTLVLQAEARVHEIGIVTPTKAPELMSVFSRACFVLGHHLRNAYLGVQRARKATADRRAVVTIDVVPGKLEEKKLRDNETNREAIIQLDPEHGAAMEREAEYEAILLYLRRKIDDMEGALNAVKKVLGETEGVFRRHNHNMSAGAPDTFDDPHDPTDLTPASTPEPLVTTTPGGLKVGRARY